MSRVGDESVGTVGLLEWMADEFLRAGNGQHPSLGPPRKKASFKLSPLSQTILMGCVLFPNLCVMQRRGI